MPHLGGADGKARKCVEERTISDVAGLRTGAGHVK